MGFHEVFGALYAQMGVVHLFTSAMDARLFRQAVLPRLAVPGGSKLANARRLSREDGVEVPVVKFYRMMDAVTDKRIVQLQAMVAREVTDLLSGILDVHLSPPWPMQQTRRTVCARRATARMASTTASRWRWP